MREETFTMERTERVELTALCLLHQNGRYLLQDRVKKDWRGFTLPGGHVEPEESIVDAIVREMKEETGLTITNLRQLSMKESFVLLMKEECIGLK